MKLFKSLSIFALSCLALLGLGSCNKKEEVKLVDTFYQSNNVRISAADGVNKNHVTNTYKLEIYSDSTYILTYTQTNAFTALDMTYGRIITSNGTYTVKEETTDSVSYDLAMPTSLKLAAFSRNKIHTFADSENWNLGNEEEGIAPGLNYKLFDYGTLESYETVEEFMTQFARKYTVAANLELKNMEATVVDGKQVDIQLIGME